MTCGIYQKYTGQLHHIALRHTRGVSSRQGFQPFQQNVWGYHTAKGTSSKTIFSIQFFFGVADDGK